MPVRRRRLRRPRPRGFPWLSLILASSAVVVVAWWSAGLLKRHFAGYVFPAAPLQQSAQRQTAADTGVAGLLDHGAAPSPIAPTPLGDVQSLGAPHAPRLAIIIDDCGNNLPNDEQFLSVPAPLTLAILPLTAHGRQIAEEAQDAGKAIMLHLPMEPVSIEHNPGPGAITTSMTDEQIAAQIQEDLLSLPPVDGANNHMGSKGTSDPRVMRDVLAVLKRKHLFFIDSETTNASLGAQMAREMGLQTASRDVFLDNDVDVGSIEQQLRQAQQIALERGQAIAIGHSFPETAVALAKMIPQMKAAGIEFVLAETLVR